MIQIVTVVNNPTLYESLIRNNHYMNCHDLVMYDNTVDNLPITVRYNDFISHRMYSDAWVVFCHQDFYFTEDISHLLRNLDKNFIYGPIGAGPSKQLIFVAAISRYGLERFRIGFARRSKSYGQILQITPMKSQRLGQRINRPTTVDTVDCCCMIVHSSLIDRYGLYFDEKLKWHLYAEDFCLGARFNHNIYTKAIQVSCVHMSGGKTDMAFHQDLLYIKNKYNTAVFATTCYDGYERF